MLKRWNLSLIDVALIILLLALAAVIFPLTQANAETEREKATLGTRIAAAEINLSQADKEASLASLLQRLEQAQSASVENPLPSEAAATAATSEIMQYAEEDSINITKWDSIYTSVTLNERSYSALSHSISADGEAGALISFIAALPQASVTPIVQSLDITKVQETENSWQMGLELLIYYR